jgi:hypothetical protein
MWLLVSLSLEDFEDGGEDLFLVSIIISRLAVPSREFCKISLSSAGTMLSIASGHLYCFYGI